MKHTNQALLPAGLLELKDQDREANRRREEGQRRPQQEAADRSWAELLACLRESPGEELLGYGDLARPGASLVPGGVFVWRDPFSVDRRGPAGYAAEGLLDAPRLPEGVAMLLRLIVLLAACLVLLQGPPARSQPPAAQGKQSPLEKKAIRTDRYGDPLPNGVVARLGTERLALHNNMDLFFTFSPEGRRLAAHNGDEDLRVWEVATGKEVLRLKTPRSRGGAGPGETQLTFSPDTKALALSSQDLGAHTWTVRVWGVDTGKELHHFTGLRGRVGHLAFTPDGRSLLAGSSEGPVLCWDLARGGPPRTIGDFPRVAFLAVSRDGTALTAGTGDRRDWQKRTFVRWDLATGKEIGRHSITTAGRWACALSPEGNVFASPDPEGESIALLDPLTGRERGRARGSDYPAFISLSSDGTAVTCSSKDGTARVWDAGTGKPRARFKPLSTGFRWTALSPDGKLLALAGRADNAVHIWDVAAGRELHSFAGHRGGPLAVAFIGGGTEVATVSRGGGTDVVTVSRDSSHTTPYVTGWADWSFRVWDAATGAERAVTSRNPGGEVRLTAFSADGRRLATVIHDGTLRLWDVEAGKELRTWKVPTEEVTRTLTDPAGVTKVIKRAYLTVFSLAFTPDAKTLLAAGGSKLHRWEVATGKELLPFQAKEAAARPPSYTHALSPDGRTLLTGSSGRRQEVILVDATTGKALRRLEGIRGTPRHPGFSPDGRTVAVGESGAVSLWEVASGRVRGRLRGPRNTFALAFSPDGRFLAVGSHPEVHVTLWDLTAGEAVGRLEGDCGRVESLAFSPDGSRLAVAGESPAALVYDVAALRDKPGRKRVFQTAELTADELEALWAELAGADAARAYRALLRLGAAGPRGVAFLKKQLQGGPASPGERRITRLIADLDHDDFAAREKASAELEAIGPRAEPALRRALAGEVSPEGRTRVKRLLDRLGSPEGQPPSSELVRLRVLEALEANGTPEARRVLAELAAGPADSPLAREAKASLDRLSTRPAARP
jgi:WD40 repeat protein